MKEYWKLNGIEEIVDLEKNGSSWKVTLGEGKNSRILEILDISLDKNHIIVKLHNETLSFCYSKNSNGTLWVSDSFRDNHLEPVTIAKKRQNSKEEELIAPMPGIILAHKTTPGTNVKKGDPILVMEAMKMEYTINAPHDGILKRFYFAVGEKVQLGSLLAEFAEISSDK